MNFQVVPECCMYVGVGGGGQSNYSSEARLGCKLCLPKQHHQLETEHVSLWGSITHLNYTVSLGNILSLHTGIRAPPSWWRDWGGEGFYGAKSGDMRSLTPHSPEDQGSRRKKGQCLKTLKKKHRADNLEPLTLDRKQSQHK